MKTSVIGLVSLAVGVGGGAYVGGTGVKDEILAERAQAHADSIAAAAAETPTLDIALDHEEGGVSVAIGTEGPVVDPLVAPDQGGPSTEGGDPGQPENTADAQQTVTGSEPEATDSGEPDATVNSEVSVSAQPAPPPQPDSAAIQGAIKLAQIFSAMKPVDAAAVLQEMTDIEVEAILQHMQSRLAGQVLGEFDPERAALLSRVVLGGVSGS